MNNRHDDVQRLRRVYEARARDLSGSDRYSMLNVGYLFAMQQRQRQTLQILKRLNVSLEGKRILEVGCGGGNILYEYLGYIDGKANLHGTDLMLPRLEHLHLRLPHIPIVGSDARQLPYRSGCFDLVLQYTVFSSILDDGVKQSIAADMRRVLQPDGAIIWYDFWLNPTNVDVRGIRPEEVRRLFPNCEYRFYRMTLAPPIARPLVRMSHILCQMLENLKIFNTHYFAVIRPRTDYR